MGAVMIRCPRTDRAVSTEIETVPSVFRRLPEVAARMRCPACGEVHVWTMRDAWLGEPLFSRVAERWLGSREFPDVDATLRDLGVVGSFLDDRAPGAALRRAITGVTTGPDPRARSFDGGGSHR